MMPFRTVTYHDDDGNVTSVETYDLTWPDVLACRTYWFEVTDLWYLKDRWDGLSSTHKGQLNTFRQELRDLPEFDTANDAGDNFPSPEDWFEVKEVYR